MVWAAVIVAAGRGVRFGGPKQLIEVGGRPLVSWCIETFGNLDEIAEIVIATEPEHMDGMAELAGRYAQNTPSVVVVGGATRQGSTRNGIRAVSERCEAVLVHDGARPLVTAADVRAGMAAVAPGRGAVLAAPVVDTIKVVPRGTRTVTQTLDRAELWAAQTPQFAMLADLFEAHVAAEREGFETTDDVALLERFGYAVDVVPATGENFKVTLPSDRDLAETILRERRTAVVR